jgi:hypothetical protein
MLVSVCLQVKAHVILNCLEERIGAAAGDIPPLLQTRITVNTWQAASKDLLAGRKSSTSSMLM